MILNNMSVKIIRPFFRYLIFSQLIMLALVMSSCTWYNKKQLAELELHWSPLRDSVISYLDSLGYLPRQAGTYIGMMRQDTMFFRLFDDKSVARLNLVRGEVEKANAELLAKDGEYRKILRLAESNDLIIQQTKRYLNGVYNKEPQKSISDLNQVVDSLRVALHYLKAEHKKYETAIQSNFFMHKDLHNNLMKPYWDSIYAMQPQQPIADRPAPKPY